MARLNGLLSHSSMQSTRSWTAYSSFNILDLVFSLCSHFLPFMSAGLCRVNFHYCVDFVGCPGMISNDDFISGNSDQSTLHLRAFIHSNFNSYWSKYMQKTDDAENSPLLKKCTHFRLDVYCRPIDRHVFRVVNVIVNSHSWLHQANGLLKGIPILRAQGTVVHEQDFYSWVHYPVLGHCRVAELISSIAALMNFCSSALSNITSTETWRSFISEAFMSSSVF